MADQRLTIKLDAEIDSLRSELRKADSTISGSVTRWERSFASLGTAAKRMVGSLAAIAGTASIASAMSQFAKEADLAARNLARTEALLKATGNTAGTTAQALREQARQIALATLQSTESVQAAQQALLTFRSVTGQTFERTIQLGADMAAVFGGSLTSSVTQLGKALEDPITGLTALRRVGVSFSEEQKAVIKAFAETNRVAEAQAVILDTLAEQFGGVAEAESDSLAGALDELSQRWQEFGIGVAESTGAVDFFRSGINKLSADLEALTNWLDGLGFQRFADEQSRFNYLVSERIRLEGELNARLIEAERASGRNARAKRLEADRLREALAAVEAERKAVNDANKAKGVAEMQAQRNAEAQRQEADARQRAERAAKEQARADQAAAKAAADYADQIEKLRRQYDATYDAQRTFETQLAELQMLLDAGVFSAEQFAAALAKIHAEYMGFADVKDAVDDIAQEDPADFADEFDRASERIRESLTDALLRAFMDGEDFGRAFSRSLAASFKTMVLEPVVSNLVGTATDAVGLTSNAGNLLSAGNLIGDVWTGAGLAGSVAGYAGTVGASLAGGAGVSQAAMLASQTSAFGLSGAAATGTALGTSSFAATAAAVAPVVIPLAIAGMLAAGIFGDKTDPRFAFQSMRAGGPENFEDQVFRSGALGDVGYRGASHGMKAGDETWGALLDWVVSMDAAVASVLDDGQIDQAITNLDTSLGTLRDIEGATGEDLRAAVVERLETALAGIDGPAVDAIRRVIAGVEGGLDELSMAVGQVLAVPGIQAALEQLGQSLGDSEAAIYSLGITLQEVPGRVEALVGANSVLQQLGLEMMAVSEAGGDAALTLVEASGGLANLSAAAGAYYDRYFSEQEKLEKVTEQVGNAFAALGESVPDTMAEFRALVESLDLTTEAGAETFAALMKISPAFAVVAEAAAEAAAQQQAVADQVGVALATVGLSLDDLGADALTAAGDLADAAGGVDALAGAVARYYELFYSEAERAEIATEALAGEFAALSLAMPETAAEFRDLVESLDLTSREGRSLYAQLMRLAPAFAEVAGAVDAVASEQEASAPLARVRSDGYRGMSSIVPDVNREFHAALGEFSLAINEEQAAYWANAIYAGLRTLEEAAEAFGATADGIREAIDAVTAQVEARRDAAMRLLELADAEAALQARREAELATADEATTVLLRRVHALEDEIRATEAAGDAIRENLTEQLADIAADREAFQAAADRVGDALTAALNTALADVEAELAARLSAIDAERQTFLTATSTAGEALRNALGAELARISEEEQAAVAAASARGRAQSAAAQASVAAARNMAQAAQEAARSLDGMVQSLDRAVASLRDVPSVTAQTYDQASAELQAMLSAAYRGVAPDADRLDDVLGVITGRGMDSYASAFELERERLVQANRAETLSSMVGRQRDAQQRAADAAEARIAQAEAQAQAAQAAAQAQIAAIQRLAQAERDDAQARADEAQAVLDALLGVDNSVLSLDEAIAQIGGLDLTYVADQLAEYTAREDAAMAEAEAQRAAIETMAQSAQDMLDALLGVDNAVMSLAEAVAAAQDLSSQYQDDQLAAYDDLEEQAKRNAEDQLAVLDEQLGELRRAAALEAEQALALNALADALSTLAADLSRGQEMTGEAIRAMVALLRSGVDPGAPDSPYQGTPQFASGGWHAGGLRIVGERGPEIEATGASRIWSAEQTARMLGAGSGTADEIRALRADQRAQAEAMVKLQRDTARIIRRWDIDGLPTERVEAA